MKHHQNHLVPSSTGCLLITNLTQSDIDLVDLKYAEVKQKYETFDTSGIAKLTKTVPVYFLGVPYSTKTFLDISACIEYTGDYLMVYSQHSGLLEDTTVDYSKKGLELMALHRLLMLYQPDQGMELYLSSHQCEIIAELRREQLEEREEDLELLRKTRRTK